MRYFNICSKKSVQANDGIKSIFNKVGIIKVTENGGWYMTLYQQPDTDFQVFPSQDESLPEIEA